MSTSFIAAVSSREWLDARNHQCGNRDKGTNALSFPDEGRIRKSPGVSRALQPVPVWYPTPCGGVRRNKGAEGGVGCVCRAFYGHLPHAADACGRFSRGSIEDESGEIGKVITGLRLALQS